MIRGPRVVAAAAIILASGFFLSQFHSSGRARAAEPQYGVPHAECTLFGPQREQILRGDRERQQAAPRYERSASYLTDQVVRALPAERAPGRSRSGAMRASDSGNYIDTIVFRNLQQLGIPPAAPATDQEFLRRVTLDLTGRIPAAQDVAQFLADPAPDKRARVIEKLLAASEWADRWAMFFGDLYKNTISTPQVTRYQQGRDAFYYYIVDSLRENKDYKNMARELMTGSANNFDAGQVNFVVGGRVTGGPVQDTWDQQAALVASTFLGISHLDCILCHDGRGHLDTLSLWGSQAKRLDAWGMAAFFSRTDLRLEPGTTPQPWDVIDSTAANRYYNLNTTSGNRPSRLPVGTTKFITPKYIFTGATPRPGENWRDELARFVTSDFQFARATVNYIWKEFMTVGIVDPPDQFDPLRLDPNKPPPQPWTLEPSNPQLLDALAQNFIRNNYDLKALMRDIANSQTYQLSARYDGPWDPLWEKYYARKLARRLTAEEIHDAVVLSSGVGGSYHISNFRTPTIDFAMQLPDVVGVPGGVGSQFLDSFLRGNRYDAERRSDSTILQALNLMNSPFVYNRARNVKGTLVNQLIGLPDDQLVTQMYLSILSRYPTADEKAKSVNRLENRPGPRNNMAEDLAWALYNKVDFIFTY
ncbi:MAG TPA: DUF1553 domain-containing protein [Bryobacterales bacterium]|nr:DUF1553 domain-containing protein [Bryobacterales bacterium]